MASLLEPISNTRVYDHTSRVKRTSLSTSVAANDSYGDLWGENSFQSTVNEGRPEVIKESTAEKRWNGHGTAVPEHLDAFLSPPIDAPLNDVFKASLNKDYGTIYAINKEMRKSESKRRGSNDLMPIRPDRRISSNTMNICKDEMAELMRLDDKLNEKLLSRKVEGHLEEDKRANIDEVEPLSPPIIALLNDEVDKNIIDTPVTEARPQRRGSNDLMPIKPDRRCSANDMVVDNAGVLELMQSDD